MSFRYPKGGFITVFYDPLQVPNAPTSVSAAGGDSLVEVTFSAPSIVGGSAITGYVAQTVPGGISATGTSSPITLTGLTNGTSYTINVAAINSFGPGPYGSSGSVTPAAARGLYGGGAYNDGEGGTGNVNIISYITISTTGNATDFGDLSMPRAYLSSCSSVTRGLFCGGLEGTSGRRNTIDYVTIASAGNATDFGDISDSGGVYVNTACSSSTRGLIAGGQNRLGNTAVNTIEYLTIASPGNTTDFGDLSGVRTGLAACASPTRGIFAGGTVSNTRLNIIEYVTIATTGNTTDFGDLLAATEYPTGCSSSTRGLFFGGGTTSGTTNVIQYITIASIGNATDFGDLSTSSWQLSACSSPTRAVTTISNTDFIVTTKVLEYVTIESTGNSVTFGNLLSLQGGAKAACSSGHGGL